MNIEEKEIRISKEYVATIINGFPTRIIESNSKTVSVTGDSHYIQNGSIRDISLKEALDLGILDDLLI